MFGHTSCCFGWRNATYNGKTRVMSTGRPAYQNESASWVIANVCPWCNAVLVDSANTAAWRVSASGKLHIEATKRYQK